MKKIKSPHLDVRQNWLNKLKEQPLLPDLSIIDPHHHLWDVGFGKYYVEELLEDIESSGHNIKATVYIMSSSNTKIYLQDGLEEFKTLLGVELIEIAYQDANNFLRLVEICSDMEDLDAQYISGGYT